MLDALLRGKFGSMALFGRKGRVLAGEWLIFAALGGERRLLDSGSSLRHGARSSVRLVESLHLL